eukprot:COSAG06_NODE_4860_length_3897_cov_5.800948_2_plen_147_part_00
MQHRVLIQPLMMLLAVGKCDYCTSVPLANATFLASSQQQTPTGQLYGGYTRGENATEADRPNASIPTIGPPANCARRVAPPLTLLTLLPLKVCARRTRAMDAPRSGGNHHDRSVPQQRSVQRQLGLVVLFGVGQMHRSRPTIFTNS